MLTTSKNARDGWFLAGTLTVWLIPTVFALTLYPPFYEDEPWVFLAAMEFVHGKGFSWEALGETLSINFTFNPLAAAALALSPLDAPSTIRLFGAVAGCLVLVATYLLGRALAPATAFLAPVVCAFPLLTDVGRFGRTDALGLGCAVLALALSVSSRPLLAGTFSGLAFAFYAYTAWALPAALVLVRVPRIRNLSLLTAGFLIGFGWQLIGLMLRWDEAARVLKRFGTSSALSGGISTWDAVLQSLASEPARYASLFSAPGNGALQAFGWAITLGCLAGLVDLVRARRWRELAALLAPPLFLALFVRQKSVNYLYFVLPSASVLAALGAQWIRGRTRAVIGMVFLGAFAATNVARAREAALGVPTQALASRLSEAIPNGAAVVAPLLVRGYLQERPDIRFYAFHAFSDRQTWRLPECEEFRERILRAAGQRPTYLVWDDNAEYLLRYLRLIDVKADERNTDCFTRDESRIVTMETPAAGGQRGKTYLLRKIR